MQRVPWTAGGRFALHIACQPHLGPVSAAAVAREGHHHAIAVRTRQGENRAVGAERHLVATAFDTATARDGDGGGGGGG